MNPAGPPTFKLAAHDLVDLLPSDATWDDLIDAIKLRQSVEAGMKDIREGRLVPSAEVRQRLGLPANEPVKPVHVSATAQDCPVCKLVNPPTAQRCDCGYDFAAREMRRTYLTEKDLARAADDEQAKAPDFSKLGIAVSLVRFFRGR